MKESNLSLEVEKILFNALASIGAMAVLEPESKEVDNGKENS